MAKATTIIPILDLSWAADPQKKTELLKQLHSALFDVGFLYIINHGVPSSTVSDLVNLLPRLFALPDRSKGSISKINSPHFLGYSGFAEEKTLGKSDLREQFDFATELPVVYRADAADLRCGNGVNGHTADGEVNKARKHERDFSKLYWRLRGPNQWPSEDLVPGFRPAFTAYHDALQELSYQFVNLVEEAFHIPVGTFDHFFGRPRKSGVEDSFGTETPFLPPQHRIKLLRYPPSARDFTSSQGVGAHKDSSGWLTFLYQVGAEPGLEVFSPSGDWLSAKPIPNSFVVNFGNAFEAATNGAVKATIHRVVAPSPNANIRYSIPFFQGLPLDMTVSEVRQQIPEEVRSMRRKNGEFRDDTASFLDARWDSLGESQLRKWIRSHQDVALKHYGSKVVAYYTNTDVPKGSSRP